MKIIKNGISLIIVFIAFLIMGELGLIYTEDFQNSLPSTTIYYQPGTIHQDMVQDVLDAAEKHQVSFFVIHNDIISNSQKNTTLYISAPNVEKWLFHEKHIEARQYTSLFLGGITISFLPYTSIPNAVLENSDHYYIIGNNDSIISFKLELIDKYAGNHPQFSETLDTIYFTVCGLWGMVYLLLIILTLFYIKDQKKELLLKFVYGESRLLIISKEAAIDILFIFFGSILIQSLLGDNTSGIFFISLLSVFAILFFVSNSLLYVLLLRFSPRMLFSNRNISLSLLLLMYILRVISMTFTSLILSSNYVLAKEALSFLSQEDFFEEHADYYYTNIGYIPREDQYGQAISTIEDNAYIKELFYQKYYSIFRPIMISHLARWNATDIVYANGNAVAYLRNHIPDLQNVVENNCYYIIPKRLKENNDVVYSLDMRLRNYISENCLNNKLLFFYSENIKIVNIDEMHPLFSKISDNPIIILDLRNIVYDSKTTVGNPFFLTIDRTVMYNLDEAEFQDFINEYHLTAEIHGRSNVYEVYLNGKIQMIRVLKMTIFLAIFFIILELLILHSVTRIEFGFRAYKISIMKLLGYTKTQRFLNLYLLSICCVLLSSIITFVMVLFYELGSLLGALFVIVLFGLIELYLINREIEKLEKRNIPLILKGEYL